MGSRMARRLLDAGHQLVVWNRTAAKAEPFAALGAEVAGSPAEAASGAEVVITVIAGPEALEALAGDALPALAPEAIWIEMSTVGPEAIQRLSSRVPKLVDAPVLGSLSEAESGTLKIFAGGPATLVQEWTPFLSALGEVMHVGPLGSGAAAKLVANSTLLGVLGVLGEALALARAHDLSPDATFQVLAVSPLASQAERRREAFVSGRYPRRFALALARKDADLIAARGADLRLAAAARSWVAEAEAAGWGERDYSSILAWIAGDRPAGA